MQPLNLPIKIKGLISGLADQGKPKKPEPLVTLPMPEEIKPKAPVHLPVKLAPGPFVVVEPPEAARPSMTDKLETEAKETLEKAGLPAPGQPNKGHIERGPEAHQSPAAEPMKAVAEVDETTVFRKKEPIVGRQLDLPRATIRFAARDPGG